MAIKEIRKLAVALCACFSVLLLVAAFAASLLFDWNGRARVVPSNPVADNCSKTQEGLAQASNLVASDELRALDAEQEDVFYSDSILAPAEVLGFNDTLDAIETISKKTQAPAVTSQNELPARVVASALGRPPLLEAPANARPNHKADLRRQTTLRLHWNAVTGAAEYHVRAWQFHGNKQIVLADQNLKETEFVLEPMAASNLFWQVTARDNSGNNGKTAGPLTVQLIGRTSKR